jgi:hypothetical protein
MKKGNLKFQFFLILSRVRLIQIVKQTNESVTED